MPAERENASECERIIALLGAYSREAAIRGVMADIDDISGMLNRETFSDGAGAERRCSALHAKYRQDMLDLYGLTGSPQKRAESCYVCLQALRDALVRVACRRLCGKGLLSLPAAALTGSDGMLLMAIKREKGRG